MVDRHDARSWDSFLPVSYKWLESLKVTGVEQWPAGSFVALPCQYDNGIKLDQLDIEQAMAAVIGDKAKKAGWKGKGPLMLEVQDSQLVLLPISSLKVEGLRRAREAGLDLAKFTKDLNIGSLVFASHKELPTTAVLEGYLIGLYEAGLFKGKADEGVLPETVALHGHADSTGLKEIVSFARATMFTRMLQDAPANWLTPVKWGQIATDYFGKKNVECKVLSKKDLIEENMGSFLSVAQGSPIEPRLISIKIKGRSGKKKVALVGKGLTFDAGGISLKPSAGMGEMKYDMSGGAAVMGAAHYLADQQPDHDVHCVIGAVENMPSGTATRPGDIVQARNGKTIEVLNTDAEGRLVLADLLSYVSDESPDFIVDLATLTGAVLHGLGHAGAAVMGGDENAVKTILNIGQEVGEPLWQLPLWPELEKEVKSDVADLKNIAKPAVLAGTIMGGMFLKEFVKEGIPWVHMDIAGTGWSCQATGYPKTNGSAFGVRSIVQLCSEKSL